jgi:SAM-dependent methyltransferase
MNSFKWFKKKISWNIKYFQGKWNFMEKEDLRYKNIYTLIYESSSNPKLLDLGCGFGTLLKHFKNEEYSSYVGIDLSSNVISKAKKRNYPKSKFLTYNIQKFIPNDKFDVIIFNEVIYYLDDPLSELKRYSEFLTENGYFIISIYGVREDLISLFKENYKLEKQIIISDDKKLTWGINKFIIET